jgi:hypothetical protein
VIDRDLNAAINIEVEGLRLMKLKTNDELVKNKIPIRYGEYKLVETTTMDQVSNNFGSMLSMNQEDVSCIEISKLC